MKNNKQNTRVQNPDMPLGKRNYQFILIGIAVIILGFILLSGGGVKNPETEFSNDIFSFRRLFVAPILLLAGFAFEIYAIMYRPKQTAVAEESNTDKE